MGSAGRALLSERQVGLPATMTSVQPRISNQKQAQAIKQTRTYGKTGYPTATSPFFEPGFLWPTVMTLAMRTASKCPGRHVRTLLNTSLPITDELFTR